MKIVEILEYATELKKEGKVFSNFYFNNLDNEIEVETEKNKGAIIFIILENEVKKLYFFANNNKALSELLILQSQGTIINFVQKGENVFSDLMKESNFNLYAKYIRKSLKIDKDEKIDENNIFEQMYDENCGEYAILEDIPKLMELMRSKFDPKSDYFPTVIEWKEIIENQWAIMYKEDDEILSLFIYKIEGKKYYGCISINDATADILYNIEKRAYKTAIEKYGVNLKYAWFDEKNAKAIRRTSLQDDGISNCIYIKER